MKSWFRACKRFWLQRCTDCNGRFCLVYGAYGPADNDQSLGVQIMHSGWR